MILHMEENWKPVVGYEAFYSVSDIGRIRSEARFVRGPKRMQKLNARVLKPWLTYGYPVVGLRDGFRTRKIAVHLLVLGAFVGRRPCGMEACHNDGRRDNPALSNLRWDTPSKNNMDKVLHGTHFRGEKSPNAKLTLEQVKEIKTAPGLQREIGAKYGICQQQVQRIRAGARWSHVS